jgi:hypothetical protein
MKTLLLTLTVLLPAQALAADHRGFLHEAWENLESAAFEVKNQIADGVEVVRTKAKFVKHERPLLLSEYVTVVKNGDKVVLVYCDSRLKRLADRQACEKLHNRSFKVDDLKSCRASAPEELKQPGMILERNLAKAADSEYAYDFFKMYDSKDNYKAFLMNCEATLAARKSNRHESRPVVGVSRSQPASTDFQPVEPAAEAPAASEAAGTL